MPEERRLKTIPNLFGDVVFDLYDDGISGPEVRVYQPDLPGPDITRIPVDVWLEVARKLVSERSG